MSEKENLGSSSNLIEYELEIPAKHISLRDQLDSNKWIQFQVAV